ncbi:spore germination protein GerW family protein [Naasia aerilata]|uniref:Sporulation protein YtfJ n=1 Tax=Naasia aerilata TaxID=1162966 RepID=A0ABN6XN76_9MICO|nr:spore germination protein GerW family protein [Naasia aerilata]BDZ46452.1 hypothetical protein GCM10025866_23610 [Naasia aerilata]
MTQLVVRLGEMFTAFGAKAAYGDPIEVDGKRIVPVALLWYGFGAGSDEGEDAAGGGGGGGATIPVGAYVTVGNTVRFQPNVVALCAVAIPLTMVAGRALSRVVKALKK